MVFFKYISAQYMISGDKLVQYRYMKNKKTTFYLLFVTLLALLLNLGLSLFLLDMEYFLKLLSIEADSFIYLILSVAILAAVVAFIFSAVIARFMLGLTLIKRPSTYLEKWLFTSVERQSRQLGIAVPQIGVFYASSLNAFATGWGASRAIFAVSSGLLENLDEHEIDAVIGHELAHIENGDMVTLALSQGLVVSITELPARLFGVVFDHLIFRGSSQGGFFYSIIYWFCMLLMGILPHFVVMHFSRQREFLADRTSAFLNSAESMVSALRHLSIKSSYLVNSKQVSALGISSIALEGVVSGISSVKNIFSSHPTLNRRIYILEKQ